MRKIVRHVQEELQNYLLVKAEGKSSQMMPKLQVEIHDYDVDEDM